MYIVQCTCELYSVNNIQLYIECTARACARKCFWWTFVSSIDFIFAHFKSLAGGRGLAAAHIASQASSSPAAGLSFSVGSTTLIFQEVVNSPKVWCDNRRKSSVRRKELGSWRRQFRGKTKVARHHCLCCRRIFRSNRKLIYSYWGMKLCKVSKRKCARILLPGFSSHPRSLPKRVFQPFQFVEGMQSWGNLEFWITWMSLAQKVGCTDLWPASFWKRVFTMEPRWGKVSSLYL